MAATIFAFEVDTLDGVCLLEFYWCLGSWQFLECQFNCTLLHRFFDCVYVHAGTMNPLGSARLLIALFCRHTMELLVLPSSWVVIGGMFRLPSEDLNIPCYLLWTDIDVGQASFVADCWCSWWCLCWPYQLG